MRFFQGRAVFLARFRRFSGDDLCGVLLLLERLQLAFQDRFASVEFVDGLFGFLQFSTKARIHRRYRFIPHDGQWLCDISSIGFERHLRTLLLQ